MQYPLHHQLYRDTILPDINIRIGVKIVVNGMIDGIPEDEDIDYIYYIFMIYSFAGLCRPL